MSTEGTIGKRECVNPWRTQQQQQTTTTKTKREIGCKEERRDREKEKRKSKEEGDAMIGVLCVAVVFISSLSSFISLEQGEFYGLGLDHNQARSLQAQLPTPTTKDFEHIYSFCQQTAERDKSINRPPKMTLQTHRSG